MIIWSVLLIVCASFGARLNWILAIVESCCWESLVGALGHVAFGTEDYP